jgi:tRNA-dihydrouridine synthase C
MAKGLSRLYSGWELGRIPLGAQIMGSYLPVMERLVPLLLDRGAPRIDLNCGCPASRVTGKGAGSRCDCQRRRYAV